MRALIIAIAIIIVAPLLWQDGAVLTACASGNTAQGQVLGGAGEAGNCSNTSVNSLISTVVNVLSIFVGVLAVIMIIYSGFRYITSGGDGGRVAGAKNTLIYAIIGLVIAALARLIVVYVLNKSINS
jgi:ABC-type Fe3+ transport system permease subunit